ncbi:hypothetical protein ACIP98_01950 [Streptomyces sp. NPDC088354]|uniref:hypothetical protein n=1 Tax=Streptomyces sp. NPDC088354 TaxID=3365856 RepID=UPI00382E1D46
MLVDNLGADTTIDVTYTYDFSELAGIADVSIPQAGFTCTTSGMIETCHGDQTLHHGPSELDPVHLTSVKGNKIGDDGAVKVTAQADGVDFQNAGIRVRVGGPDLGVSPLYSGDEAEHTTVGDVYKAPLGFANWGSEVQGILLKMDVTDGLDFVTKYSNCEYATRTTRNPDTWSQPVTEALCEIDRTFGPGMYGHLDEPVQLAVNKRALVDAIHYQVFEDTAAARASARGSAEFTKGTGPALTVTTLKTIYSDEGGNATDTWHTVSGGMLFETHNTADFVARGGAASGSVGDTVTATVGFTNQGPAWFGAFFATKTETTFTVPQGAEVVHKPEACKRSKSTGGSGEQQAAALLYTCLSHSSVNVGQTVSYTFTLKIDKVVKNASGSVEVSPARVFEDATWAVDKNLANNTATFVLTGKPGNGTGGGSGSGGSGSTDGGSTDGGASDGGNSPGDQGHEGALAHTGATGLQIISGVALVALGAGGGLWVVGRRRKAQV